MSTIPERFWAAHIGLAEVAANPAYQLTLDQLRAVMQATVIYLTLWAATNHKARPQLTWKVPNVLTDDGLIDVVHNDYSPSTTTVARMPWVVPEARP